jgi:hypothetical protein
MLPVAFLPRIPRVGLLLDGALPVCSLMGFVRSGPLLSHRDLRK